jgi:hypothetical protein
VRTGAAHASCLIGAVIVAPAVVGCSEGGGEKSPPPRPAGEKPTRAFAAVGSGVTVMYPGGWKASARNDTAVPNPALCFVLRRGRIVEVKLVEYLPPALDRKELRNPDAGFVPQPKHFRYSSLRFADADWIDGTALSFRAHGRAFFAGVHVAHKADPATRRTVERILDTIRARSGRCRPTSGVGSRRFYRRLRRMHRNS